MTEQEYGEKFGWANLIVETLWPEVDPDALVTMVENEPDQPNLVFTLRVFDAQGHTVGDPIVKMIARAALSEEMAKRRARTLALMQGGLELALARKAAQGDAA
jgi:hypothetical protein